jgi:hypothetical protein
MDRTDAIAWVLSLCTGLLRKSQAKTLSDLVGAALGATRMNLAEVGRQLASAGDAPGAKWKAAKHAIKRVWRFIANERVEPVDVMPVVMTRLWRRKLKWHAKRPDRRPLLVSLDWTKVRGFHTLMAAVVVQGRALPWCWESYKDQVQGKSQNALEYALMARLKAALPAEVRIVILADRGFGRAALVQECQKLGLDYLVRVGADVKVKLQGGGTRGASGRWQGNLKDYPLHHGQCLGWTNVEYRADGLVITNLIARWKKGLAGDQDQPWYLVTSLPVPRRDAAERLSDLYALRFDIEEWFRDSKNEHLGWSLAKTRITRPDRLDRLILILALAYLLLVAVGLWCRAHYPPKLWASNNRVRELSAFAIGRVMRGRVRLVVARLIDLLLRSLATPQGNWG